MAEFFVERQGWAHWPRTLLMCRKRGDGIERRRYVPDRGECRNVSDPPEGFLCSVCNWGDFCEPSHLLAGARFCPNCGREVVK